MGMCKYTIWRREDDVLFEFLRLLFGTVQRCIHSQDGESVHRFL
jgi:hypothetical protein